MLVQAMVRSCERGSFNDKPNATLVLETTNPLEIISVRLFGNAITDGTVSSLESLVGQTCLLPLGVDIYRNSVQYQFPFGAKIPQAPHTKKSS